MGKVSRRRFLGQASAISVCTLTDGVVSAIPTGNHGTNQISDSILPAKFPGRWAAFGRLALGRFNDSAILQDGFVMSSDHWKNNEFRFRARAPKGTEEVQIWAGVRCLDRDRRYVFALRGGNNDDVYLARYAPDGGIKFLGIAPLDFHPVPETWYVLRTVVRNDRFQIYLNDEPLPRINVVDDGALWGEGSLSLGGGWLPAEFCEVEVRPLTQADAAFLDTMGDRVWENHPQRLDRRDRRARKRTEYRPANIAAFDQPRMEIPLNGKWLFLPDQEQPAGPGSYVQDCDDTKWHVMDVPDFWTPTVTWLYGETGFSYLVDVSAMKGVSDKLYLDEVRRLDSYTFDWRDTRSAWYRHYVDLPADIRERRFELCFDAIATVSDVWVNGVHIVSHTGMFGAVRHDITSAVKPGRNVIAVHAVGQIEEPKASDKVLGVAVTVEVTESMLNSLPHGMYHDVGGIWQPVKLIVTGPIKVDDVYIQPRLDGLDCEVITDGYLSGPQEEVVLAYSIRSVKDKTVLYASSEAKKERIELSKNRTAHFSISGLAPELWSPQKPNLYDLEITLTSGGRTLDRRVTRFGFRTFAAEKGRLLLNGKPFWLRGANHFPHALRPNDGALAHRFMKLAKDGNVVATRSHTAPFSRTWLEAADEIGMAVSFEGTWPWLMLRGGAPTDELIRQWQDEFISLIRQYRNHPSIIIWTVNNEMKFAASDQKNPEQLRQKWEILTRAMKAMRKTDPSRPIVCDSSYCRKGVQKEYDAVIRPNGFDDGDIDDAHVYPGWYNKSFFHYFHGEFGAASYSGRPLISQELSTGYPRNDDGHPARFYLFKHYTPQSLVGDEAYENRNPAIFLKRQAFLTKELAEAIRRTNRRECSGILHFAYLTWFKDVWNSDSIRPFETYFALRTALQPVLVSAELYGRHFYAGSTLPLRVCIMNDAENGFALPATQLGWEIRVGDEVVASGTSEVPQLPYYSNMWINLSIQIPAKLQSPRVNASLRLFLSANHTTYSENSYDIVVATSRWAAGSAWPRAVIVDPNHEMARAIQRHDLRSSPSPHGLKLSDIAVLGDAAETLRNSENAYFLKRFITRGGRALLLHAGEELRNLFPDQIKGFKPHPYEIATMHVPESPAFDGLEPLDLAWWDLGGRAIPQACRGSYQVDSGRNDVEALADAIDFHGYLNGPEDFAKIKGSPLIEIRMGKGRLVASEMMLLEASPYDPIARRILGNLIQMLSSDSYAAVHQVG